MSLAPQTAPAKPLPIDPTMVSTTDELPGYRITCSLGVSEGIGVAIYKGVLPSGQKDAITNSIREAFLDMLERAAAQGSGAIVGLRYALPASGGRIVVAYGSAVKVERL